MSFGFLKTVLSKSMFSFNTNVSAVAIQRLLLSQLAEIPQKYIFMLT